jgi:uncharacterized protein (DUF305 family)
MERHDLLENATFKRTLVLLVASTALTLLALAAGLGPEPATPHGVHGYHTPHDAHGDHRTHSTHVRSEAEFVTGMIPHHQEAIESARVLLTKTERPELRGLAQEILKTQTREVALLQSWVDAWFPGATRRYTPMMRELAGLHPDAADRVFLEDMIRHHQGALEMAQAYLEGDFEKHPEVVALAEQIVRTQGAEIARMQGWLAAW